MSAYFTRPVWQSSLGITSANARLVPGVALSGSPQHDPYFVIEGGQPNLVGGTSASAPVFASIVVLIAEALGANGLGNINPSLYALASEPARVCPTTALTQACVFHDITSGNNMVPCTAGTNGCSGGLMGYAAGPGYDMVTGLGSIDAARLFVAAAGLTSGPLITSVATAYAGAGIAQNTFIVY